jgi:hypothetical protein
MFAYLKNNSLIEETEPDTWVGGGNHNYPTEKGKAK